MKKKVITLLTALAVAVTFIPVSALTAQPAFAASKLNRTVYDQVVKKGSYIYCAGEGSAIYKVKVKDDKVVSKKKIVKSKETYGAWSYISGMSKYGKYIYYFQYTEGTKRWFKRVKISTGKVNKLPSMSQYAFKKKMMYTMDWKGDKKVYLKMTPSGKNPKKTKVHASNTFRDTNVKGYSVRYKEKKGYARTYLKTPAGTFYLGKSKID